LHSRLNGQERAMLNNLSELIRDCYRHAQDCARKAVEQSDPNLKQDFLELEESWLFLARSFEFNERLGDSSDVMNQRKSYEFVQSLESFVLEANKRKIEGE
jgi:hypothetical protein